MNEEQYCVLFPRSIRASPLERKLKLSKSKQVLQTHSGYKNEWYIQRVMLAHFSQTSNWQTTKSFLLTVRFDPALHLANDHLMALQIM